MAKTGLLGPYRLSFDEIGTTVDAVSAGAFAIGHIDQNGRFCINHIGRSDTDIGARLRDHIGSGMVFKYGYCDSPRAAFEKECQLFHDFSPPGNRVHPGRPSGTNWECPRCRIFVRS